MKESMGIELRLLTRKNEYGNMDIAVNFWLKKEPLYVQVILSLMREIPV